MKVITAWTIIDCKGYPTIHWMTYRKRDTIKSFREGDSMTWKELRKIGWDCKRIKITIEL